MAMLNNQRVRYLIDLEETTVVAFDIRIQSFPEFPASEASDFSVLAAGTCTKRGNKQHWALGIRWKDCMYIYIYEYIHHEMGHEPSKVKTAVLMLKVPRDH